MSGLLNINKPLGPTSHDVVARVRRILRTRRVGHSGTLDPQADGVLLVAVGAATRLVEYLNDLPKSYRARIRFGRVTDTQDATGTVLEEQDAGGVTQQALLAAARRLVGEIEQVPPMYSAIKMAGQPLYERARRGEVVERAARRVTIYALDVEEFTPGPAAAATLRVDCSAGTYIRTLCHDLGAALGPGALMETLTRTAIGPFRVEEAVSLEELERLAAGEGPVPWIALAETVAHLPHHVVSEAEAGALRQGRMIRAAPAGTPAARLRLVDAAGALVAIGRPAAAGDGTPLLAPEKVFPSTEDERTPAQHKEQE